MKKILSAVFIFFSAALFFGEEKSEVKDYLNPAPYESMNQNLDFIFSTESLGSITITMKRSEWNQLLKNYDYFYKNENLVKIESFEYEKENAKWLLPGGGIKLRGNSSRFRPQGKDSPDDKSGHHQMNADWSQEYYYYASSCSDDDYRQSHFKVDFTFGDAKKNQTMAECLKGVALKRMDASCSREIFCYDMFHRYGIWAAPRASHTKVSLKFIEADGKITTVNFGVYEMFEEVTEYSLKARSQKENQAQNAWLNEKGNLWKISGGADLAYPDAAYGCEENKILSFDENGNPTDWIMEMPTYDLKTNKKKLNRAKKELKEFITELNALPDVKNAKDKESIQKIKTFYEQKMDVDLFLKTYAVNILLGMDDDYWGNANNCYLYFNEGKMFFIPFDYDNTLGCSILGNEGEPQGIQQNPLEWGRGQKRPLMDKMLQVPEFKEKFINYLFEVSAEDSEWNFEDCSKRFLKWKEMAEPYLNSPDLDNRNSVKFWGDFCWKPAGLYLTSKKNNIYDYTRKMIWKNLGKPIPEDPNALSISEVKKSSEKGITIEIKNIPENAHVRQIFVNGKMVQDISWDEKIIKGTRWNYPYVKAGNKYTVKVSYLDNFWRQVDSTDGLTITAKNGLGEISVSNIENVDWKVENNIFKMTEQPKLLLNEKSLSSKNSPVLYVEVQATDWSNWGRLTGDVKTIKIPELNVYDSLKLWHGDNFKNMEADILSKKFMIKIYYVISYTEESGPIRFNLMDMNMNKTFTVKK
ncbi:MAG: CotH kinase family protein [Treponema sp.]|nr:CotH kinase family protein [Treponema sp.]